MADSSNMAPMVKALNGSGGMMTNDYRNAPGTMPTNSLIGNDTISNVAGGPDFNAPVAPPIMNTPPQATPLLPNETVTPAMPVTAPTTGIPPGETVTMPAAAPPAAGMPQSDVLNWLGGANNQSASLGNSTQPMNGMMPFGQNMYSALMAPPPATNLLGAAPLS